MAARLCPHCDIKSNFNFVARGGGGWGIEQNRFVAYIDILTCQNCGGILLTFSGKRSNEEAWMIYPASIPKVDTAVPTRIVSDFVSAVNCHSINEYKAAATMYRRTLQQIMIDKEAKGSTLQKQIDDLAVRQIITSDLKDWAHEIRLWGNEGAHPSDDGLDEITGEELQQVRDFIEQMFSYIYIMPAKLAASRLSRTQRNT